MTGMDGANLNLNPVPQNHNVGDIHLKPADKQDEGVKLTPVLGEPANAVNKGGHLYVPDNETVQGFVSKWLEGEGHKLPDSSDPKYDPKKPLDIEYNRDFVRDENGHPIFKTFKEDGQTFLGMEVEIEVKLKGQKDPVKLRKFIRTDRRPSDNPAAMKRAKEEAVMLVEGIGRQIDMRLDNDVRASADPQALYAVDSEAYNTFATFSMQFDYGMGRASSLADLMQKNMEDREPDADKVAKGKKFLRDHSSALPRVWGKKRTFDPHKRDLTLDAAQNEFKGELIGARVIDPPMREGEMGFPPGSDQALLKALRFETGDTRGFRETGYQANYEFAYLRNEKLNEERDQFKLEDLNIERDQLQKEIDVIQTATPDPAADSPEGMELAKLEKQLEKVESKRDKLYPEQSLKDSKKELAALQTELQDPDIGRVKKRWKSRQAGKLSKKISELEAKIQKADSAKPAQANYVNTAADGEPPKFRRAKAGETANTTSYGEMAKDIAANGRVVSETIEDGPPPSITYSTWDPKDHLLDIYNLNPPASMQEKLNDPKLSNKVKRQMLTDFTLREMAAADLDPATFLRSAKTRQHEVKTRLSEVQSQIKAAEKKHPALRSRARAARQREAVDKVRQSDSKHVGLIEQKEKLEKRFKRALEIEKELKPQTKAYEELAKKKAKAEKVPAEKLQEKIAELKTPSAPAPGTKEHEQLTKLEAQLKKIEDINKEFKEAEAKLKKLQTDWQKNGGDSFMIEGQLLEVTGKLERMDNRIGEVDEMMTDDPKIDEKEVREYNQLLKQYDSLVGELENLTIQMGIVGRLPETFGWTRPDSWKDNEGTKNGTEAPGGAVYGKGQSKEGLTAALNPDLYMNEARSRAKQEYYRRHAGDKPQIGRGIKNSLHGQLHRFCLRHSEERHMQDSVLRNGSHIIRTVGIRNGEGDILKFTGSDAQFKSDSKTAKSMAEVMSYARTNDELDDALKDIRKQYPRSNFHPEGEVSVGGKARLKLQNRARALSSEGRKQIKKAQEKTTHKSYHKFKEYGRDKVASMSRTEAEEALAEMKQAHNELVQAREEMAAWGLQADEELSSIVDRDLRHHKHLESIGRMETAIEEDELSSSTDVDAFSRWYPSTGQNAKRLRGLKRDATSACDNATTVLRGLEKRIALCEEKLGVADGERLQRVTTDDKKFGASIDSILAAREQRKAEGDGGPDDAQLRRTADFYKTSLQAVDTMTPQQVRQEWKTLNENLPKTDNKYLAKEMVERMKVLAPKINS